MSHLICNAGVAPYYGKDWFVYSKQFLTDFFASVTFPIGDLERPGIVSEDGLGWVWQTNLFGHYVLVSCMYFVSDFWFDGKKHSIVRSNPSFQRLQENSVLLVCSGCPP